MVVTCLVKGCKNNNMKSWNKRFFSLPSPSAFHKEGMAELYRERRNLWVQALHRDDLTETKLKYGRICSDHFHSGKPARWAERDHPDWVPSNSMGDDISHSISTVKFEKEDMPEENGLHLTEVDNSENKPDKAAQVSYLPNIVEDGQQLYMESVVPVKIEENIPQEPQVNYVFEVVPNQANIEVIQPRIKPWIRLKGGRTKKNKDHATTATKRKEILQEDDKKVPKLTPRTRSGIVVDIPNYIVNDSEEVITAKSQKFLEPPAKSKPNRKQGLKFHQQRRRIAAQFRRPKCQKAYLDKNKMMQHIQKHPDHGPIPQSEKKELNFDLWNFLVDITQKCPQAQRGAKFCEELTNLMHNLLLSASALFKKVEINKSFVEVGEVLGNAIGLKPGPYSFNDNELNKDTTLLQLLTTDFFKPSDDVGNSPKDHGKEIDEAVELSEHTLHENSTNCHFKKKIGVRPKSPAPCIPKVEEQLTSELIIPDDVVKKTETSQMHGEILNDNSSIMHLSNNKTSVDELMMSTVDPGGSLLAMLLDNSTSSDEVMNVDQFVNERFKKITGPDFGISSDALKLDLNTLDLFEYESS